MTPAAAVAASSDSGDPPMERVFVFDASGTLFHLGSLQPHVEARCPGYGAVITQLWRLKQLEYSWLHSVMGEPFSDFWAVTVQSLQFALTSAGCHRMTWRISRPHSSGFSRFRR